MMSRHLPPIIRIEIDCPRRGVGKTRLATFLTALLRTLGYNVEYVGLSESQMEERRREIDGYDVSAPSPKSFRKIQIIDTSGSM